MAQTTIKASAPGKVILHGEYAVVFEKHAIATAVGLRTYVQIELRADDKQIKLTLDSFDRQQFSWDLDELQSIILPDTSSKTVIEMSDDVKNLLAKLTDKFETCNVDSVNSARAFLFLLIGIGQVHSSTGRSGMNVEVRSEFPVGAGLGSSAAFSVSVAGALFEALGCPSTDQQLISDWAFQCERMFHGKPSGIDNSICTFGGTLLFRDGKIVNTLTQPPNMNALLVNTNVRRNTKVLVGNFVEKKNTFPDILANIMNAIDCISQEAWSVYSKEQLDAKRIKTLAEMNHQLLNAIGAGHEKIDTVAQISRKYGATAKITGAGGGGCVTVFLDPEMNKEDRDNLQIELKQQEFQSWPISLGGNGLTVARF